MNLFSPVIFLLHSGHLVSLAAHSMHIHIWVHGKNTLFISRLLHTAHLNTTPLPNRRGCGAAELSSGGNGGDGECTGDGDDFFGILLYGYDHCVVFVL